MRTLSHHCQVGVKNQFLQGGGARMVPSPVLGSSHPLAVMVSGLLLTRQWWTFWSRLPPQPLLVGVGTRPWISPWSLDCVKVVYPTRLPLWPERAGSSWDIFVCALWHSWLPASPTSSLGYMNSPLCLAGLHFLFMFWSLFMFISYIMSRDFCCAQWEE